MLRGTYWLCVHARECLWWNLALLRFVASACWSPYSEIKTLLDHRFALEALLFLSILFQALVPTLLDS